MSTHRRITGLRDKSRWVGGWGGGASKSIRDGTFDAGACFDRIKPKQCPPGLPLPHMCGVDLVVRSGVSRFRFGRVRLSRGGGGEVWWSTSEQAEALSAR